MSRVCVCTFYEFNKFVSVVNVFPLGAQFSIFFIGSSVGQTCEFCLSAKVPLPILGN
jgi:hypothetical protein